MFFSTVETKTFSISAYIGCFIAVAQWCFSISCMPMCTQWRSMITVVTLQHYFQPTTFVIWMTRIYNAEIEVRVDPVNYKGRRIDSWWKSDFIWHWIKSLIHRDSILLSLHTHTHTCNTATAQVVLSTTLASHVFGNVVDTRKITV